MKRKLARLISALACIAMFVSSFAVLADENVSNDGRKLPSYVDLSEEKYFPMIREQQAPSCAAWSSTYYQFTYQVARMNDWDVKSDVAGEKTFSPRYIWTYLNDGNSQGTTILECLGILSKKGALRWSEFPELNKSFSWFTSDDSDAVRGALYQALENRVSSFEEVSLYNGYATDTIIKNVYSNQIVKIKELLNTGHCLSFNTFFSDADRNNLSSENGLNANEKVIVSPKTSVRLLNHGMTIVGYNDDIWFDYNGDGEKQAYELGALKIADSNKINNNDGFIWVMYDALNRKSNVDAYNYEKRSAFLSSYYTIEVQHYTPNLTVELTIEQQKKNDISITLGSSDSLSGDRKQENTFLQKLGGGIGFYATENNRASYTEVFDYSIEYSDESINPFFPDIIQNLFDGYDKYYWINIEDVEANNDAVTTVKRVCWRDKDRNIIKEIYPNDTFDGATKSYESKTIPASRLELNKNSSFLTVGNTEQLTATVTPENTYNPDVEWQSDNKDVVSVDQTGKVTAVGKGTATVSAKTTDGSGLVSSCTYKVVNVAVSEISMIREKVTLHENQTVTAKCSVSPSNADDKTVSWVSDDEEIVTISQDGVITAKKKGSAYIRAVANDGSGVSCRCLIEVIDDHGDTPETATNIIVHSPQSGKIDVAGDADYFGFTAKYTGTFIFYTTGNTDTVGYLYDSDGNQLAVNDHGNISRGNFAFKCDLVNGRKYYIKVMGSNNATGDYNFIVTRAIYSASVEGMNQDARHVQMKVEASSILTKFRIWIGDTNYNLEKPTSGDLDVTVKGVHFKVNFESKNNGYSTVWNVHAKIPSSTEEQLVYFAFNRGALSGIESESIEGFLPYKSSIKTGIDPNSNLQALLNSMKKSGYTLKAKNWDNSDIAVNSSVKAATGMKIIKTDDKTGKIVEVYYLVLFGDVTGNGVVGDGEITVTDALHVLQEAIDKSVLPTEIARLAADVDHDGEITQTDATMINQAAVNKITIDQSYVIVDVPDECVYNCDVEF